MMNATDSVPTAASVDACLTGVRILDLGRYIAAPYCANLLATQGAEVIRVEPPEGATDREVMPVGVTGRGGLYLQVNGNKKSLSLNYSKPAGREILEQLIATADVLIVNLPRRALHKLSLDYDSLKRINPRIILTTISAFDYSGEESDRVGFDGTGQALSGAMFLTGSGERPTRAAVSYVDYSTALSAAFATMSALMQRQQTGAGQHVSCSLMGTALTMMNPMLMEEASGFRSRRPIGNRSPIAGPSDLFQARDGWLMIQIIGDAMFARWAKMMGREDLLSDARFADDSSRGEHGEELSAITALWCSDRSVADCLEVLDSHRLPACRCLTPKEALQLEGLSDYVQDIPLSTGSETLPVVTGALRTKSSESVERRAAPELGQDTEIILKTIGYDSSAIANLRRAAVV